MSVSVVDKCSTTICRARANMSTSTTVSAVCLQSILINSSPTTSPRERERKEVKNSSDISSTDSRVRS